MKRLLRWTGIAVGILAGLAIVAYAVAYVASERILRRVYEVPAIAITIPTDAESITEGRRLATTRGCVNGCHGKNAEGTVMFNEPMIARIVAPNLTAAVRKYSDAQIAAIVRNGVRPDGRSMLVMPAEAFTWMTDADLGRIIAFLKSLPPSTGPGPDISPGPLGRIGLATGKFKTVAQLIADAEPPPEATGEQATFGRYVARTTCTQCHGTDLRGASTPDFTSPDLRIAGAYSPEAFATLMRTGVPLGERKLDTMGPWARQTLSQLTDAEIAALYSYLHAMNK
jgi:mono/diheme cytochrome c family protein